MYRSLLTHADHFLGLSVKEISAPEDNEESEEVEGDMKRHLNVVFIGHVGRFMYSHSVFYQRLAMIIDIMFICCMPGTSW